MIPRGKRTGGPTRQLTASEQRRITKKRREQRGPSLHVRQAINVRMKCGKGSYARVTKLDAEAKELMSDDEDEANVEANEASSVEDEANSSVEGDHSSSDCENDAHSVQV